MEIKERSVKRIPTLEIGGITIPKPIVQGGMAVGISLDKLSSAVAKEGGVGIIAAILCGVNEKGFAKNPLDVSLEALEEYVKRAKSVSKGAVGVNVMMALNDADKYIEASVKAEADFLFAGAGLLLKPPEGIGCIPIVSSGRAANIILKTWWKKYRRCPDAIVVEGFDAGGHLGFKKEQIGNSDFKLELLVKDVLMAVKRYEDKIGGKIPIIAAGGVYSHFDICRFLEIGASGVQMGTRFVATFECDASDSFKEAYVHAKKDDIVIIDSPAGLPGRALDSVFLRKVRRGEMSPKRCITKCLKTCKFPKTKYCIASALMNAQKGNLKHGFAFCGSNVHRIDKIISVKELMNELILLP